MFRVANGPSVSMHKGPDILLVPTVVRLIVSKIVGASELHRTANCAASAARVTG